MRPMRKDAFISLITSLLEQNIKITFVMVPGHFIGFMNWIDLDGEERQEVLFNSIHSNEKQSEFHRQRFMAWYDAAVAAHQEKQAIEIKCDKEPAHAVALEAATISVPEDRLLNQTAWGPVKAIRASMVDERCQLACGSATALALQGHIGIHFEWKVDYGGVTAGLPCVVSFEGEPRIISGVKVLTNKPVMEILEALDESQDITGQILKYCHEKLAIPQPEGS